MGLEIKSVVTIDRQNICYNYYTNNHDYLVLVAHGFFNSKDSILLKELAVELSRNYDVLSLDFRGHGQSSGLYYWSAKESQDLLAVLHKAMNEKHYRKVGVIGFSLGATTSLIAAYKDNVIDSLIVVSPVSEFRKIDYHFWGLDFENDIFYGLLGKGAKGKGVRPGPFWLQKDKPIDFVNQLRIPILYIHGDSDWLIKPYHSEKLFAKTQSKKDLVIIKKGPHAEYLIRKNKEEIVKLIRDWFHETLMKEIQRN